MAITAELAKKCGALTDKAIRCACPAILRQVVNTEQPRRPGTTLTSASLTEAILKSNLPNPGTAPKDPTTEAIGTIKLP